MLRWQRGSRTGTWFDFEQVAEGTGDGAVVGNEPAVEIGESEELFDGGRKGPG